MKENQQTISMNKQLSVKVSNQKKPQIQAIKAIVTDMPIRHLAYLHVPSLLILDNVIFVLIVLWIKNN